MHRGPKGEKQPADAIGAAVMVGQIATGKIEEKLPETGKEYARMGRLDGRRGRAESLTPERRREIAQLAAKKCWGVMSDKPSRTETAKVLADEIASSVKADVLVINGGIESPLDHDLIKLVVGRKRHPSVLLILTTEGGSADAGFRIARCLQSCYSRFVVVVPGWCKSAGTLIAVGAHELVIGDLGELGPLDVQLTRPDELGARASGLTINSSFRSLQSVAFTMFETFMLEVINKSGGVITTKTAAELSANLATGMLAPIFGQMDPMKIGEDFRSTRIAEEYSGRLDAHAQNLVADSNIQAINSLVRGYPSHGFVIDRTEAMELFKNVRPIEGKMKDLIDLLGATVVAPRSSSRSQATIMMFLNNEATEAQDDLSAKPQHQAYIARQSGGGRAKPGAGNGSGRPVSPTPPKSDRDIAIPEHPAGTSNPGEAAN